MRLQSDIGNWLAMLTICDNFKSFAKVIAIIQVKNENGVFALRLAMLF